MGFMRDHRGSPMWLVGLLLSLALVACAGGEADPPPADDGDVDFDWNPDPTDGDRDVPDSQPEPEGEPVLSFRFGEQPTHLADWQVVDVAREREGASDWRIQAGGLVQRADLGPTRSPRPEPANSHLVSTDLRYSRRQVQASFVELVLSPGELKGGFGISLENGLSEILLCLDEAACGGRFARWNQSGHVLGVSPVGDFSRRETLTLRVSVDGRFGMVTLDGETVLTVALDPMVRGRVGILLYLLDEVRVHSLRVWGETGPELPRPPLPARVVALRGAGKSDADSLFPENSLEAVRQALSMGVDAVLVDLRLTADGVPVLLHDSGLERTTDCTGPVAEMESGQLADCTLLGSPADSPLRVPSLDALLQGISRATLWLHVYGSGDEVVNRAMVRAILAVVNAHNALGRVRLVSDEYELLRYARVESPALEVLWRVETAGDTVLQLASDGGIRGVLVSDETLSLTDLDSGRILGLLLGAWAADAGPAMRQWLDAEVDILLTNHPDRALGLGWGL